MSSRLTLDSKGRLICVVTATCDASLRVGEVFIVRGNDLPCNQVGFGWLGTTTGHRRTALDAIPLEHGRARLPDASAPRRALVGVQRLDL